MELCDCMIKQQIMDHSPHSWLLALLLNSALSGCICWRMVMTMVESHDMLASWPISMWAQLYNNKVQRIVVGGERWKKLNWWNFWLQTLGVYIYLLVVLHLSSC